MRNLSRIGSLKRQAHVNAANVIVRRDLAIAYLELRQPRTALRYIDEALVRDPRNQELAYLRGTALLRTNELEPALRSFGAALGIDPDSAEPLSSQSARGNAGTFRRYGEALLGAAQALEGLERFDQAEQALESASTYNTSILEPFVRLARVRRRKGDTAGADAASQEARRTFTQLPAFMKRRQSGWWLRSWV